MEQHLVIGTAGHIDHGKTALVRALTGTDTDRLPEEKRRGISIDLGFASLDLGDGRSASIVDVPGHERFIRNMVAGVTGIDAVLLVIAADEGIMPQTREHLDIVSLLGVTSGIVALTKVDLVWPEWLEDMKREVRTGLEGSFLARSPMVEVSAVTGRGVEDVRRTLAGLRPEVARRLAGAPARLPVDRVFTVPGFGTVVTGTMAAGRIVPGDRLHVLPPGGEARVRGLEIHGRTAGEAVAGQRVATNLAGVSGGDLERGQVLAAPGHYLPVRGFGGSLTLLRHPERPLTSGSRVRLHTGTAEALGRVLLLDRDQLEPGETAFIHLRSETPLVIVPGDRFIIRRYSPLDTVGGGQVLDVMRRYRRFDRGGLDELEARERGDHAAAVVAVLNRPPVRVLDTVQLGRRLGIAADEVKPVIEDLLAAGKAFHAGQALVGRGALEVLEQMAARAVDAYHTRYPLRPGMPRPQLRQEILPRADARVFQALVELMVDRGTLIQSGDTVCRAGFSARLDQDQERRAGRLVAALDENPFEPPPLSGDVDADLLRYLEARGDIVVVSRDLAFSARAVARARELLEGRLRDGEDGITVAGFRDLLGTSRRYVLALLNHFDAAGVTRRVGDLRYLRTREAGDGHGG